MGKPLPPKFERSKEGTLTACLFDEDNDPIRCRFYNDGCVEIDTSEVLWVALSLENLELLKTLIKKAESITDIEISS
jgi:hypothetical protein